MIDPNQKKYILGSFGERILSEILRDEGYDVNLSMNPFDNKKDFIVNGSTVEVKTQVPFYSERAFSIAQNQYHKCTKVNYVAFIAVPVPNNSFTSQYDGNIYVAEAKDIVWKQRTTYDGRVMYLAKIHQPAMRLCHTIKDRQILNSLSKLTTSSA